MSVCGSVSPATSDSAVSKKTREPSAEASRNAGESAVTPAGPVEISVVVEPERS